MSSEFVDPRSEISHDIETGQVYEDTRSGDLVTLLYVDDRVALLRDEEDNHRVNRRSAFDKNVGSGRYSLTDQRGDTAGPSAALSELLSRFEDRDGRKAKHKAEAVQEALDALSGESKNHDEVPLEDISGIGSRTAARLRSSGFSTVADVRASNDDELLDVGGMGEKNLGELREYVADRA